MPVVAPVGPVKVEHGDSISLNCTFPDKFAKKLAWHRSLWGSTPTQGRMKQVIVGLHTVQLIIHNIQPSDAGSYKCSYKDTGEQHSSSVWIIVTTGKLKVEGEDCVHSRDCHFKKYLRYNMILIFP